MHGQAERYPGGLTRGLGEGADLRSVGVVKGGADKKQTNNNIGLNPHSSGLGGYGDLHFHCILLYIASRPQPAPTVSSVVTPSAVARITGVWLFRVWGRVGFVRTLLRPLAARGMSGRGRSVRWGCSAGSRAELGN